MFHSQRIGAQDRRLGNPGSFDQSWRSERMRSLYSESEVVREEAAQKKRFSIASSREHVEPLNDIADVVENGPAKRDRRIDSAVPDAENEPKATESNSIVLNFAKALRASLADLDDGPNAPSPPLKPAPFIPDPDSFISTTVPFRRRRRHGFHQPRPSAHLLRTREDILHITSARTMSRPETALRQEIFYQEQDLRKNKARVRTKAYRQMAIALAHNRRHLVELRIGVPGDVLVERLSRESWDGGEYDEDAAEVFFTRGWMTGG